LGFQSLIRQQPIPSLTEEEILDAFRPGSIVVYRTVSQILALGLTLAMTEGADTLPERIRIAHREIRPSPGVVRTAFKAALKELEE
jgi:hypothetical protein